MAMISSVKEQIEIEKRIADACGLDAEIQDGRLYLEDRPEDLKDFNAFEEMPDFTFLFNPLGSMDDAMWMIHTLLPDIKEIKFTKNADLWRAGIASSTLCKLVEENFTLATIHCSVGHDEKEALCLFANEIAKTMELQTC